VFVEDGHADDQAYDRVDRHHGRQAGAQRPSLVGKLVDQEAERADADEGIERPRRDQGAHSAVENAHIFLQQPCYRGVRQAGGGTEQSRGGTAGAMPADDEKPKGTKPNQGPENNRRQEVGGLGDTAGRRGDGEEQDQPDSKGAGPGKLVAPGPAVLEELTKDQGEDRTTDEQRLDQRERALT
jgi:hypothetical protein